MAEGGKLEVRVKYGDLEAAFAGDLDEVMKGLFRFLSEIHPPYEALARLTIGVSEDELLKQLEGIIGITREGVYTLVEQEGMSERDRIQLQLVRAHVAAMLGYGERPSLPVSEILELTGGKASTVTPRLSELVGDGLVERVGRGEYKITTLGLRRFIDEAIPRLRRAIGA